MLDSTSFIIIMDLIGTIAFAVSGAMVAVRKKMDIFGVNILAVVTATGGGVIRDLLIGRTSPMMFHNPFYVMLSAITANIVFIFIAVKHSHHKTFPDRFIQIYEKGLFWADALGLASFTVDGEYFYHQRKNHRLTEWSGQEGFSAWVEALPYSELITA